MFNIMINGPGASDPHAVSIALSVAQGLLCTGQDKAAGVENGREYTAPEWGDECRYKWFCWWTEKRNIRVWIASNEEER